MKHNLTSKPFTEFVGKPRQKLYDYLQKNYKDRLPTEEVIDYLVENPDEIPEFMKDGNWYYFIGSICGLAHVPCAHWYDNKLDRSASWLSNEWFGNERVVLTNNQESSDLEARVKSLENDMKSIKKFLII